jgi:hypothetical protein
MKTLRIMPALSGPKRPLHNIADTVRDFMFSLAFDHFARYAANT